MKTQAFLFCLLAAILAKTVNAEEDINFGKRIPSSTEIIKALSTEKTDTGSENSNINPETKDSGEINTEEADCLPGQKCRSIGKLIPINPMIPKKPVYHPDTKHSDSKHSGSKSSDAPKNVATPKKTVKKAQPAEEIAMTMEIRFAYNSSELTDYAKEQLKPVGEALGSNQLQNLKFIIEGHTDAVGSDAYNYELSKERAASVKAYLIDNFSIESSRIQTVGKGKTGLLDPKNPDSEVNRRVRIVATK